jgi:hypothetical protein
MATISPIIKCGMPYKSFNFLAKYVLPEHGGPVIKTLSGNSPLNKLNSSFSIVIVYELIPLEHFHSKAFKRADVQQSFTLHVMNSHHGSFITDATGVS